MDNYETTIIRHKKGLGKGRSLVTFQNKTRQLKKFYRKTFENSKKSKERDNKLPENKRPRKKYFCDKYPTEDSFFKKNSLKQPNITKR